MKTKWLNFVLLLTNRIYVRKQNILTLNGIQTVGGILVLILLEIVLAIISLPIYLTTKSSGVVAFLEEKGAYEKVSFDYNLRRILTVTGVGIILLFWLIKLLVIVSVPSIFGPLKLYQVSDLRPAEITDKGLIQTETGIQTARISSDLAIPVLSGVNKEQSGNYLFFGQAKPQSTVVLLLSDLQTVIYSTVVNDKGYWEIRHLRQNLKLKDGNHSILIFSYDAQKGVRSEVAPTQYFKVTTHWFENLTSKIDILANWSAVLIIALGIFLTFLTI